MTEDALTRAEELAAKARELGEKIRLVQDPDEAADLMQQLAELDREAQAQLDEAKRRAEADAHS